MHGNTKGAIVLVFSMAVFSLCDGAMRLAGSQIPVGETIAIRSVIIMILTLGALAAMGQLSSLQTLKSPQIILRSICDASATGLFLLALQHMPMADMASIQMLAPIILTLLSIVFMGEIVRIRRWIAIVASFAGAVIVAHPGGDQFSGWSLIAFAAAAATGARDLFTLQIRASVPSFTLIFATSIAVLVMTSGFYMTETWIAPTLGQTAIIASAAANLVGGTALMILAFRISEPSAVAPFRYTFLITSAITGYLMFGNAPDKWFYIGASLIAGSGLYTIYRETLLRRQITLRSGPPA